VSDYLRREQPQLFITDAIMMITLLQRARRFKGNIG